MIGRQTIAIAALVSIAVLGVAGSLAMGAGSAAATVGGDTNLQQTVIEGEGVEFPEAFVLSVSGNYEYDSLPAEADRVTVRAWMVDDHESREDVVGQAEPFAEHTSDVSGTSGEGSFADVSGDVDTPIAFDNQGPVEEESTTETTVDVYVETVVHYGDGQTLVETNSHEATFRLTRYPPDSPSASLNASSSIAGEIVFESAEA